MNITNRCTGLAFTLLAIGCSLANGATQGIDPMVARTHFIGTQQLFADREGAKLKEIWNLPGSIAFRNATLDRFSKLPAHFLSGALPKNSPDQAAVFRPLFEDLLANESYSDIRATPEFVIAVKLPEARAKAWDAALKQAVAGWKLGTPAPATADGFSGWEIKLQGKAALMRVGRAGEWTVITAGPANLTVAQAMISAIKQQRRPAKATGAWLDGSANLAQFQGFLPVLKNYQNVPVAHFSLSNRTEFVRTLVRFDFAKPHGWKAEPWKIPTNSIYDPLITFTAARGIAPLLESIPELRRIGWSPTPNQFTGWGMRRLPFQFYYSTPARDIENQLQRAAPKLQEMMFARQNTNLVGKISLGTNKADVYWEGLPLAVPRLFPLRDDPSFLGFEVFPLAATKTRPPQELFQQLSREKLVYYDWEITEDRIPHWKQAYQIAEIATRRQLTSTNAPSMKFLTDVTPKLGEAVTELTATSPSQMTLVRKSHLGLSSFELVSLARWIESTNFPSAGFFPPQPPRRPPTRSGTNAAPAK